MLVEIHRLIVFTRTTYHVCIPRSGCVVDGSVSLAILRVKIDAGIEAQNVNGGEASRSCSQVQGHGSVARRGVHIDRAILALLVQFAIVPTESLHGQPVTKL